MTPQSRRPRETTSTGEMRRNPRFPKSRVWTDEERERHRTERDATIEQAGLVTDRLLEDDETEVGRD
ncbi:MAG: hypothetical protein JJT88_14490 [Gammaproteobacteria bacterium]|nr:hypothetical protein [Gammaproteobacteria bacterium]